MSSLSLPVRRAAQIESPQQQSLRYLKKRPQTTWTRPSAPCRIDTWGLGSTYPSIDISRPRPYRARCPTWGPRPVYHTRSVPNPLRNHLGRTDRPTWGVVEISRPLLPYGPPGAGGPLY